MKKDTAKNTRKCPLCGAPVTDRQTHSHDAKARLSALKEAGIDTDALLAVALAAGGDGVMRLKGGTAQALDKDDPLYAAIAKSNVIPDRRLFRRWVMSQALRMLSNGFTQSLRAKGDEYPWKMLVDELHTQKAMERNGDKECLAQRQHWFNASVVADMTQAYIDELRKAIEKSGLRLDKKGAFSVTTPKGSLTQPEVNDILRNLNDFVRAISEAGDAKRLYTLTGRLFRYRARLWKDYGLKADNYSAAFMDAYKGAGGYFTLRNLILFHGARIHDGETRLSQDESLKRLDKEAYDARCYGYKMLGLLKQVLKDENIDIEKKRAEWRRA